jgi:predicted regulator of Ras-like GTPase activity (Roadblock/LC7/MglB family)
VATPFTEILRQAVDRIPRAIGGAFAAPDGEMVDYVATIDPIEWAIFTAHYGVVLAHLEAALGTWHFGGPEFFVVEHSQVDVLVHTVDDGYFALIAVEQPAPLGAALSSLADAAAELRREMRA